MAHLGYSNEDFLNLIICYGECNRITDRACLLFAECYPNQPRPNQKTVPRPKPKVDDEDTEILILGYFTAYPNASLRDAGVNLRLAFKTRYHLMSKMQKELYIQKHFTKECVIPLTDINRQKKLSETTQEVASRNRKSICYVCLQKFSTSEELESHRIVHEIKMEDDTLLEKNEDWTDEPAESSEVNLDPENVFVPEEKKTSSLKDNIERNFSCIKCKKDFVNQVDIKAHKHIQYYCKYLCKLCDRQFNTRGGFIVHVLQHDITQSSNKLLYLCDKCPLSFDDCYRLKRHYSLVHDDQTGSIQDTMGKPSSSTLSFSHDYINSTATKCEPTSPPLIFDCDICYDVYTKEEDLVRHKKIHKDLEARANMTTKTIAVEECSAEIVHEEDTSNKHDVVANFSTSYQRKPSPIPSQPISLTEDGPSKNVFLEEKIKQNVVIGRNPFKEKSNRSILKKTLTSGIKTAKPNDYMTISNQGEYGSKNDNINEILKKMPPLRPLDSLIRSHNPTHPPSEPIAAPSAKAYHLKPLLPSTIPQEKTPSNAPAQNQYEIASDIKSTNDQINPTVPVINPQTGGFLFNPNIGNTGQGTSGLPTLMGMPPNPPGQLIYIVVPTNQLIQGSTSNFTSAESVNSSVGGAMETSDSQNQQISSVAGMSLGSVNKPQSPYPDGKSSPVFHRFTTESEARNDNRKNINDQESVMNESNISMPVISNVVGNSQHSLTSLDESNRFELVALDKSKRSTKQKFAERNPKFVIRKLQIRPEAKNDNVEKMVTEEDPPLPVFRKVVGNSPNLMTSLDEDGFEEENHSDVVMPIITGIGSVVENSEQETKAQYSSQYESEFAKFIKKNDAVGGLKPARYIMRPNLRVQPYNKDGDDPVDLDNDVIIIDDKSSESNDSTKARMEESKPKIYVKRLSDLVEDKQCSELFRHCCLLCNTRFKNWELLAEHMKSKHDRYPCRYTGCCISNSRHAANEHFSRCHRCPICKTHVRVMSEHQKICKL